MIKAKNKGGISISPKETRNKTDKKFINFKIRQYKAIINQYDIKF